MNEFAELLSHADVSLAAPFADGFAVHDPATGETLAHVRRTPPEAVRCADVLWAWYHAIMAYQEPLVRLMTRKPHCSFLHPQAA